MILRFAEVVVSWMIRHGAISPDDRELYEYALYSILFTMSPLFIAGLVGFFIGKLGETIVIILPFTFVRKFCGGYHAKKAGYCMVISSILLVTCTIVSSCIRYKASLIIIMMVAIVSLMIHSPVDSENRRLSQEEKKCCKIATIIITLFFGGMSLILYLCQQETYAICISVGIILVAGLQMPCILRIKTANSEKAEESR